MNESNNNTDLLVNQQTEEPAIKVLQTTIPDDTLDSGIKSLDESSLPFNPKFKEHDPDPFKNLPSALDIIVTKEESGPFILKVFFLLFCKFILLALLVYLLEAKLKKKFEKFFTGDFQLIGFLVSAVLVGVIFGLMAMKKNIANKFPLNYLLLIIGTIAEVLALHQIFSILIPNDEEHLYMAWNIFIMMSISVLSVIIWGLVDESFKKSFGLKPALLYTFPICIFASYMFGTSFDTVEASIFFFIAGVFGGALGGFIVYQAKSILEGGHKRIAKFSEKDYFFVAMNIYGSILYFIAKIIKKAFGHHS